MIRRVVPVTENDSSRSKLGTYAIADNYTAFWFRFVQPYASELSPDNNRWALAEFDRHFRDAHVSFVFEEICRSRTRSMSDEIGFTPERVGNYRRGSTDVDVMALNTAEKKVFAAECKYFESEPVGLDVLRKLKETVGGIRELEGYEITYGLFSATGFTDAVLKERTVVLVDNGEPVNH